MLSHHVISCQALLDELFELPVAVRGTAMNAYIRLWQGLALPDDRDELCLILNVSDHYRLNAWPIHARAINLVRKFFALDQKNFQPPAQIEQSPARQPIGSDDEAREPAAVYASARTVSNPCFSVLKNPEKENQREQTGAKPARRWKEAKQPVWIALREALRRKNIRLKWAASFPHFKVYRDEIEQGAPRLAADLGITLDELIERIAGEFRTLHRVPTMPGLVDCWMAIKRNICAAMRAWSGRPDVAPVEPPIVPAQPASERVKRFAFDRSALEALIAKGTASKPALAC